MKRTALALLLACSHSEAPPARVANAPIRQTAPIPTSSVEAPLPPSDAPAKTSAPPPTAPPSTGALTTAECDKVIHKFADLVAQGQNAELMGGFETTPVYIGMRDLCVKETTRKQYDCAMSAKTHQAWQECMK